MLLAPPSGCDHVRLIWMSTVTSRTLTGCNGPRFHLTTVWQWSDCECGHGTLSKPGTTLLYTLCCKLVNCVCCHCNDCLCAGRGSSADAALVSLHQILLQQPRRLAEAEERPGQHHDQRHGQDRGDGQGVQPHLLSEQAVKTGNCEKSEFDFLTSLGSWPWLGVRKSVKTSSSSARHSHCQDPNTGNLESLQQWSMKPGQQQRQRKHS